MNYRKFLNPIMLMAFACVAIQLKADVPNLMLAEVYKANGKSIVEKVDQYSYYLLGLPYGSISYQQDVSQLNTVDELLAYISDSEFQYDFDKLDCVTYVETVLALAISGDIDMSSNGKKEDFVKSFEANLRKIRYKNATDSYLCRNHFTSIDWVPNNAWLFQDISRQLSNQTAEANCLIKKDAWLIKQAPIKKFISKIDDQRKESAIFKIKASVKDKKFDYSNKQSIVQYITLDEYLQNPSAIESRLPAVAIINIVRPSWDLEAIIGTKLNVSHQGILVKNRSGVKIRHASTSGHKLVVEVSLFDYLKAFRESPTIKGFNVLAIKS